MSGQQTKKMIASYLQDATPTRFLSGFFRTPRENYHTSQSVEFDIEREDEEVAVVVKDLSTGNRDNSADNYTNKEFTPPIFKEEVAINAFDLIKREPGENPFQEPNFQANATVRALRGARKLEKKIRRSIEVQASQVFQTGKLDLTDKNGTSLYEIDYKPKADHFPTVATAWSNAAADPGADLEALCDKIRVNGLTRANTAIMGATAWANFVRNANVRADGDNRRLVLGGANPSVRGEGAVYQGQFWVGSYVLNIWTYPQYYNNPNGGVATKYVEDDKVIVFDDQARFDLTFGAIPRLASPEDAVLRYLPSRIMGSGVGLDMTLNAYLTENRENLILSVGTRPLCIPTAIDRFGCIDTAP